MGHSYGGNTALAVAGALIDTVAFNSACDSAYATDDPLAFLCDALAPRLVDIAEAAGLGTVPPRSLAGMGRTLRSTQWSRWPATPPCSESRGWQR